MGFLSDSSPQDHYEQLMDSIDYILQLLPDDTVIYPGHGTKTTIGRIKTRNLAVRGGSNY